MGCSNQFKVPIYNIWPLIDDRPTAVSSKLNDDLRYSTTSNSGGDYFTTNSRGYIFHSLFYEPNRLVIIERVVVFEVTASGVVEITEVKGYYRPHNIKDSPENSHWKLDIGLVIVTILAYLINIGAHMIKTKSIKEFIQPRHFLKYIIVILVIVYFIVFYNGTGKSMDEIVNSTNFQTFIKYENQRETANFILCLALCLHCLNMIRSLVFSKTVYIFLEIFAESYKDLLSYFLVYFSVIVAFGFVWYISFSDYEKNLSSLFRTVFEIILFFSTGNIITVQKLFQTSGTWTSLLVNVTLIIIFITFDALLMSIIQENVRYLYIKQKTQDEQKLPFKEMLQKIYQKVEKTRSKAKEFANKLRPSRR